jgi:hypothetical protein
VTIALTEAELALETGVRQRGDVVRARSSFERARALAEEGDDAQTLVFALSGLARVLAEEDVAAARQTAAEAVARASSLERAGALCAAAEVELRAADGPAAQRRARPAEDQARAAGDRAALAESLELQGAAHVHADAGQYSGAFQGTFILIWRQSGSGLSGHITISAPPNTLSIHGTVKNGAICSADEVSQRVDELLAILAAIPEAMLPGGIDHSQDGLVARINQLDSVEDAPGHAPGADARGP